MPCMAVRSLDTLKRTCFRSRLIVPARRARNLPDVPSLPMLVTRNGAAVDHMEAS